MTLADSYHLCLNPEKALLCGNSTLGASWNGSFGRDIRTYICYRAVDIHPCIRNVRSHTGIFTLILSSLDFTGTCNASEDLSILIVFGFLAGCAGLTLTVIGGNRYATCAGHRKDEL